MSDLSFSWDPHKAASNIRNHHVTFEEGTTVFGDENARLKYDPDHSHSEDRFLLLGMSAKIRVLVVVHAHRENKGEIRIISVRKATKQEQKQYWSNI